MRTLIFLLLWPPLGLFAQNWWVEGGAGFRTGIWKYDLGEDANGVYAGNGLHYTHFSPFLGAYAQAGRQWKAFSLGGGISYTLFFDKEMRIQQNQQPGKPTIYDISDHYAQFLHLYSRLEGYAIRRQGFRLGPSLQAGWFSPTTGYPQSQALHRRYFAEAGIVGLMRLGNGWLTVNPVYQWNVADGKGTDARHIITSLGVLAGWRHLW